MQVYKNWLNANSIRFNEEPFGLSFSYQGCNFILVEDSNDKQYLNLILPGIYNVEDNEVKVLKALNKINGEIKCLKAVLHGDTIWLHVEMFIDSTPDIEDFMDRLLSILMKGRMDFMMEMMHQ